MTSLEIAELTGKQHKHVMEAIRKMEPAWVNIAGSNFRLGSYKDLNGQLRPCYQLTKTECLYMPFGGSIYLFTLQFQYPLLAKMEDEEGSGETDDAAYADVDEEVL